MIQLSAAAVRLQEYIHTPDFPLRLWQQFDAGMLTSEDLQELLPQTWMYREGPERIIGAAKWVSMFRTAGFLVVPTNIPTPTKPMRIFRGATEARARGMAWYVNRQDADVMQRRHARYGPTCTYYTTAAPGVLLAIFVRPGDGPEVVLDPQSLSDIFPMEA